MAIRKIQMKPPGGDFADVDHPETDSSQVLMGDSKTLEQFKTDTNTALAGKSDSNHTHSDYVPTNRTVNGKALTGNITLAAADVGAQPADANIVKKNVATTMTAMMTAQNNTSYTTKQIRNITLSTADPSGGDNGDIWIKYKA